MINQNQPSYQPNQEDQAKINDSNPNISSNNPNYSSSRNYQTQMDFRERSRSRENSYQRRQSFHEYRPGKNTKNQGNNNFNMNTRNNKPYHFRQNNERQFDSNNRYKNERNQYRDNFNGKGYNSNYGPTKDDCLIVLPKNYYNFIADEFDKIKNDLKRELKDDIYNINNKYTIPNIPENIFRFTTNYSNNYPLKTRAIKIISDFLFDKMKRQYDKTTYLKIIFLIPDKIIGLIIGINGKTINQMRDETKAKIEVFPQNNDKKFRKIEVAGSPQSIAEAGEKIYGITRKYFYFDDEKIQRERDDLERERGFGMNNFKDKERFRRERYYDDNRDKIYENERYNNNKDRDYKEMFNRDRNEYRDIRFRDGYRNYNGRDNYMKNNSRDYLEKNNNNYNRDNNNYRDFRDNNQRYRNNYDKGNNKYYSDKNRSRNYKNEKENFTKNENWSNKSVSGKYSEKSRDNKSYNNDGDGDWPQEKELKNEEIKGDMNENKENLEQTEKNNLEYIDKEISNNSINKEYSNVLNKEQIQLIENLKNKKDNEFSDKENSKQEYNIQNNNLNNNIHINDNEKSDHEKEKGKEKGEIVDTNKKYIRDQVEDDKSCKIIVYLSSEEMNLLSNSKYGDIFVNLENSFQCGISKSTKNIDNKEICLVSFSGTPKHNTLAIYQLQKFLLDIKFERIASNKSDN